MDDQANTRNDESINESENSPLRNISADQQAFSFTQLKSEDVNSLHSKEDSILSDNEISEVKAFKNFFFRFFITSFLMQFQRFLQPFVIYCILITLPSGQETNDNVKAFNLAQKYTNFFTLSILILVTNSFDLDATINYSRRKYRKFGFQIHAALLTAFFYLIVLLLLSMIFSRIFVENKLTTDRSKSLFYAYFYFNHLNFFFEIIFILYARTLNLAVKGNVVIIVIAIGSVIHGVMSYLLIYTANLAIYGGIISNLVVNFFGALSIVLYAGYSNSLPGSIFFFKKESFDFKQIRSYISTTIIFLPLSFSWIGVSFFSDSIATLISNDTYRINVVFNKFGEFMFTLAEGNATTLVVLTRYYMGKGVSISVLKQIVIYSLLLMLILLGIGTLIDIISVNWLSYILNYDVSNPEETSFSIFGNNQFYTNKVLQSKTSSYIIYFLIYTWAASINRMLYSWFRAIDMFFIGLINPLLLGFFYKLLFSILLGRIFDLRIVGIFVSYIIFDLIGLIISFLQYSLRSWSKQILQYYLKEEIHDDK